MVSVTLPPSVERFELEYPEELWDRLLWLEEQLQIPRHRILRLMGISRADASKIEQLPWKEIAQTHEMQAERVEGYLAHYLYFFDYDTQKASDFIKDFAGRLEAGLLRPVELVPALALARTSGEQEVLLLYSLGEGGQFLPALMCLLVGPDEDS